MNFDYFLERADILTEMARPISMSGISNPEILSAYGRLRNFLKTEYGINSSSSIDLFSFRYIYSLIEDYLEPEQVQKYENTRKETNIVKAMVTQYLKQVLASNPEAIPTIAEELQNPEKINQFRTLLKTIGGGNRSVGKEKEHLEVTGMGVDDFQSLTAQISPLLKQLNLASGRKKSSLSKLGDASPHAQKPEEQIDPNVQNAIDISNVLGQISTLRSKLRDSGELEDNSEQSLFASRDPANNLKQILKGISDKAFEASIGLLINLIEQKIDAGSGQTMEGFAKLVNNIKQHPSTPPALGKLFDYVLSQLQSTVDDIYQTAEDEQKFEGYDEDLVQQIFKTPEQQQMFSNWLTTHKRWREELDRKLNERYEDRLSAAMAQLKGTYMTPEEEKAKMAEFWAKRNKAEPKTQEFKIPERDTPPVKQESVLSYMAEQTQRDAKFGKPLGEFVDRGFKKADKYSYWSV